jgi:hypothetical protein
MIKKQVILAILLIISTIQVYAQTVKIYRINQIEFDSTFYYGIANKLICEVFNAQGHKLLTNNSNLKVSLDSGTVIPIDKTDHFGCFFPKIPSTHLNIFWQGKLLQKIKVKILPIPPAQVYLTTDNLKGRPIDTNQPIPANQKLKLMIEPDSHIKSSSRTCFGRALIVTIIHQRMNKIMSHQIEKHLKELDLKQFDARSGDKFVIEVEYEQRIDNGRCTPDFLGTERLSFFAR